MRLLFLSIPLLILVMAGRIQDSPHGIDFEISCSVCHSPKGWELDRAIYSFDHNTTKLPLVGQHTSINCKKCHPTLVFLRQKQTASDVMQTCTTKQSGWTVPGAILQIPGLFQL